MSYILKTEHNNQEIGRFISYITHSADIWNYCGKDNCNCLIRTREKIVRSNALKGLIFLSIQSGFSKLYFEQCSDFVFNDVIKIYIGTVLHYYILQKFFNSISQLYMLKIIHVSGYEIHFWEYIILQIPSFLCVYVL